MVIEEVLNASEKAIESATNIAQITLWIKGFGLLAIIWIVYSIIIFFYNKKRLKALLEMKNDLKRIENKLSQIEDKLIKTKS